MSTPIKFKILFLGDNMIGKTSLIGRLAEEKFPQHTLPTIGVDFKMKKVIIDGLEIKIQIFDTAGQERYTQITKNYYKSSDGVVFMFDLTDRESFDEASRWIKRVSDDDKICKMILGNKSDVGEKRVIDNEEIQNLINQTKIQYFEVSAKTGKNVEEAILRLARDIKAMLMPPKIVIVGHGHSGKTCITNRLSEGNFPLDRTPTTNLEFKERVITVEDSKIRLQLLDTPGDPRYLFVAESRFKDAQGVLIVLDLTDQNSFDEAKAWIKHIKNTTDEKVCKIILGNKCDLREKLVIDKKKIRDLVQEVKISYFEVSAKTGENVEEAFFNFVRSIKRNLMLDEHLRAKNDEDDSVQNITSVSECNLF